MAAFRALVRLVLLLAPSSLACAASSAADGGDVGTGSDADAGRGGIADAGSSQDGADVGSSRDGATDARELECEPPAVTLLIDASGSMAARNDVGVSRWTTLREALFGSYGSCRDIESETGGLVCAAARDACEVVTRDLSCDAACAGPGLACASASTVSSEPDGAENCAEDTGTTTSCTDAAGRRRCVCRGDTGSTEDGALPQFDDRAELALATFTTRAYEDPETCLGPADGVPEPKLGSSDALEAVLEERYPSGGTPTVEALEEVYPALEARAESGQRAALILITDGTPNGCGLDSPGETASRVAAAGERGVRTYAVGLGDDPALLSWVEPFAGATEGDPTLRTLISEDRAELRDHLITVLDAEVACP